MLARVRLVVITFLLVDCLPECLPSCMLSRLPSETMRACDRLHLRLSSSYQVRGSIYHAYNFQLTVPRYRIERLLDPTTLYLCLHIETPNNHVPPHPSKPCSAMLLCSLLSHCVVCMLGLSIFYLCYSLDWAITLLLLLLLLLWMI